MKINIKTIPIEEMRYPTVGDYWYDEIGTLQVRVADMGDTFYETMVAVHEIIEEALTKKRGITEQQIMEFDLEFEAKREEGNLDEPGFDENCIYRKEHTLATAVEMMMCAHVDLSFKKYEEKIDSL